VVIPGGDGVEGLILVQQRRGGLEILEKVYRQLHVVLQRRKEDGAKAADEHTISDEVP
jgi:hypothetical protein